MEVEKNCSGALVLVCAMLLLGGCLSSSGSDDDESGETPDSGDSVTQEGAEQSVVSFLESQGYFSSAYFQQAQVTTMLVAQGQQEAIPPVPDDYVRSELNESGNIVIRLDIDEDGNILPNRHWRAENSGYCLEKGKHFRTPIWQFQVQVDPEMQFVLLRLLDLATGQIERQQDAQVPGDNWLDDGINEAWNEINLPEIQQADSPCGSDIELTLVVESEIVASTQDGLFERSTVEARIPLGQKDGSDVFEGSSVLLTTDYESPVGDNPNVTSCSWTPTPGAISGQVTIPDGNFEPETIDDLQGMIDVNIRVLEDEAPGIINTCTVVTPEGSGETSLAGEPWYPWFHVLNQSQRPEAPFSYFYESLWTEMEDDPFGLAEREINQTESFTEEGDTLTLDETTNLEIRTETLPPL